jgi:hypothetical protein
MSRPARVRGGHAGQLAHLRVQETPTDESPLELRQPPEGTTDTDPLACATHPQAEVEAGELVDVGVSAQRRIAPFEAVGELGEVATEEPLGTPLSLTESGNRAAELGGGHRLDRGCWAVC